jgi:hypothetical protein
VARNLIGPVDLADIDTPAALISSLVLPHSVTLWYAKSNAREKMRSIVMLAAHAIAQTANAPHALVQGSD